MFVFKKWGFICIIGLFILTACSEKEEYEIVSPVEELAAEEVEEAVDEIILEAEELPFKAPFTGVGFEEEVTQRPILVTINNHQLARPQSGIAQADIVYEILAEGNVTRFLALFQSEIPTNIGPVRSARDYFVDVAKGLDAFYIAHGYSPGAQKMLNSRVVDNINGMQYDGILFERSRDRKAPHNSYISKKNVFIGAEKVGASMEIEKIPAFSFYDSQEEMKIGDSVSSISIRYGSGASFENQYTYMPEEGIYERETAGILTTDKETKEPVKLSNVIFMEIPHKVIDNSGRQELNLTAGGKAYLFQGGVMRAIEWENIDGILVPMENGMPTKLVKGKSWVSFVPTNPGLENMVNFLP